MTAPPISAEQFLDPATVRASVDQVLQEFLALKAARTAEPHLPYLSGLLREFLAGGKRIRPLLCLTGWQAAGGEGDPASVVRTAAALEMFHAFALIHDDVMDNSDTRRGRPTIHRRLAALSTGGRSKGERFGLGGAVLLGDLALAWSDELLHGAGLSAKQSGAVLPLLAEMRTEVMLGQYLDLRGTGELTDDVQKALLVSRYKTAKYTIERPLHVGAAMAGGDPLLLAACTAFALPLGEAFQLRDDLLGVFGDPRTTGKSRLDDLREGKNTALVACALHRADPTQAARLRALIGDAGLAERGAAEVRRILTATGARAQVEQMIAERHGLALRALERAPFPADAAAALRQVARLATVRNS